MDALTPQMVNAGKIRLHNDSQNVEDHFNNIHRQYSDALHRLRSHVDEAIDTHEFVRASENVSILPSLPIPSISYRQCVVIRTSVKMQLV